MNGQSSYGVSCHKSAEPRPLLTTTPKDDSTSSSVYAQHGCRLSWDETPPTGDCPTCADTQLTCSTDDSEVCFTEELVRRKLLLGRCPPPLGLLTVESQYDRVPVSGSSADVVMRTFKGLSPPPAQCSGPCSAGNVYWTLSHNAADHDATMDRVRIQ